MTDRERLVRKIAYTGLLFALAGLMFASVNMRGALAAIRANF